MKRLALIFFNFLFVGIANGQHVESTNPIVYAEAFWGGAKGKTGGLTGGAALNYQLRQHLFTVRYLGNTKLSFRTVLLAPFLAIPIIEPKSDLEEFAALYGIRYIKEGFSLSLSAGISHNSFTEWIYDVYDDQKKLKLESAYIGLPYEANIRWFKKEKKKFKIYGLIPVGRPTSFGASFGFKIYGNISQNSYTGLGLTYGLGYHKKY